MGRWIAFLSLLAAVFAMLVLKPHGRLFKPWQNFVLGGAVFLGLAGASWWLTRREPRRAAPEQAVRPRALHAIAWMIAAGASATVAALWLQDGVVVNWG